MIRLIGHFLFGLPLLWGLLPQPALAAEQLFALAIRDGRVGDSAPTLQVTVGDEVVLELSSDRDLELHLHGYDIETTVTPQAPAVMSFQARIAGRFPVSEHAHGARHERPLLYLEVHP